MKSYTDIEQSKKLLEILPLESADIVYLASAEGDDGETLYTAEYKSEVIIYEADDYINCWSLSALLGALPTFTIDSSDDHYYRVHCMKRYTEWYDNPVDACYEMILNLHELKML